MRYAHKHMLAEGHKLNLLVNLWQMVVRHPQLFYNFRAHFLGQMVNTLSRLRLPANASTENKKMAVDMARVIVEWEVRRLRSVNEATTGRAVHELEEMEKSKPPLPVDNRIVKKEEQEPGQRECGRNLNYERVAHGGSQDVWIFCKCQYAAPISGGVPSMSSMAVTPLPLMDEAFVNMTRMVVTFLAKMAFTSATDSRDDEIRALYQETMRVLHEALDIWQNVRTCYPRQMSIYF